VKRDSGGPEILPRSVVWGVFCLQVGAASRQKRKEKKRRGAELD